VVRARVGPPPPLLRTKWTRRVPHPVLIGHAASLRVEAARAAWQRGHHAQSPPEVPAAPPQARRVARPAASAERRSRARRSPQNNPEVQPSSSPNRNNPLSGSLAAWGVLPQARGSSTWQVRSTPPPALRWHAARACRCAVPRMLTAGARRLRQSSTANILTRVSSSSVFKVRRDDRK